MELLSIIVPCYNEQETLGDYYKEINTVRDRLLAMECGLEVIFIDDGSRDGTLEDMKSLAGQNPWIKYLSFTRNFGKEAVLWRIRKRFISLQNRWCLWPMTIY